MTERKRRARKAARPMDEQGPAILAATRRLVITQGLAAVTANAIAEAAG